MILAFKKSFPWNEPTYFKEKILLCDTCNLSTQLVGADGQLQTIFKKCHTIREGQRWKAGMTMHMAYGIRTRNYEQFNRGIRSLQVVRSVQDIEINSAARTIKILKEKDWVEFGIRNIFQQRLAVNDGFKDVYEFWKWFDTSMSGQIIHWTDLKY